SWYACRNPSSSIEAPSMAIRSTGERRCGLVVRPVRSPASRRMRSRIRAVVVFPFVPAIRIERYEFCGSPISSITRVMRDRSGSIRFSGARSSSAAYTSRSSGDMACGDDPGRGEFCTAAPAGTTGGRGGDQCTSRGWTVPPHRCPVHMGKPAHRARALCFVVSAASGAGCGARRRGAGAMTQVTASVGSATQWASEGPVPAEDWNPVYRALREPPAREGRGRPDEATVDLVLRQLTAPALPVVAVTDAERTRRMRIGLGPVVATLEHSEDAEPSHWARIDAQEVPTRITARLEEGGIDLARARLGVERGSTALRLSAEQGRAAAGALARGLAPEEAFAAVPALDA